MKYMLISVHYVYSMVTLMALFIFEWRLKRGRILWKQLLLGVKWWCHFLSFLVFYFVMDKWRSKHELEMSWADAYGGGISDTVWLGEYLEWDFVEACTVGDVSWRRAGRRGLWTVTAVSVWWSLLTAVVELQVLRCHGRQYVP